MSLYNTAMTTNTPFYRPSYTYKLILNLNLMHGKMEFLSFQRFPSLVPKKTLIMAQVDRTFFEKRALDTIEN